MVVWVISVLLSFSHAQTDLNLSLRDLVAASQKKYTINSELHEKIAKLVQSTPEKIIAADYHFLKEWILKNPDHCSLEQIQIARMVADRRLEIRPSHLAQAAQVRSSSYWYHWYQARRLVRLAAKRFESTASFKKLQSGYVSQLKMAVTNPCNLITGIAILDTLVESVDSKWLMMSDVIYVELIRKRQDLKRVQGDVQSLMKLITPFQGDPEKNPEAYLKFLEANACPLKEDLLAVVDAFDFLVPLLRRVP